MPKIIENLRGELLAEAKRQLDAGGYAALTVRSVAKGCGIAVGTVYNYFPSKEYLVGNVVLQDWEAYYRQMEAQVADADSADAGFSAIYENLLGFVALYRELFASGAGATSIPDRHELLLGQLEVLLHRLLERYAPAAEAFTATFLAEAMLKCCAKPYLYAQLRPMLLKLLQ